MSCGSPSSTSSDEESRQRGLELLIEAAEYVEKCDKKRIRESDHGYASTLGYNEEPIRKKTKKMHSRSSHNELEKNRRAHLRNCLDNLKSIVPLGAESSRHTTLGLLNKATLLIKELEDNRSTYEREKDKLGKYNENLRRRLVRLENKNTRIKNPETCRLF